MSEAIAPNAFAPLIDYLIADARAAFDARLDALSPGFDATEIELIRRSAGQALHANAQLKLNRVLLLELHAADRAGELEGADDAARFAHFIERSRTQRFVAHLDRRYPCLRERLRRMLAQQRGAIEALLARLVADRESLAALLGAPAGRLTALALGMGDTHAGGQTVARLGFEGGSVMYKPRSLRIDIALEAFLARVFADRAGRIRVPAALDRGDYGWAAFVEHRYCEGEDELRAFYRALGHWLAALRLLGGTDIHQENLIASGPVPVVIDVESLFAANPEGTPSGFGRAYDLALVLIRGSVLRTGIVPFRSPALGFDNVDLSAAGALPDQQPQVHAPIIVGDGTAAAHLKVVDVDMAPAQNHPVPRPDVSRYWDCISEGFLEATTRLRELDVAGDLAPLLDAFAGCAARDIRRSTQTYIELGRMLWHPASLHDEAKAIERARDLFARNAAIDPHASSAAEDIATEIDSLRYGDVPIFVATLDRARVEATLADWRGMRIELEELTIRSALVATDLNRHIDDRIEREDRRYYARNPHAERLEQRRRRLALELVERMLRLAVRHADGSATWISPEITPRGWLVRPLQPGVYFGLGGVAIALAGYRHEMQRGRADAAAGLEQTLDGALHVLAAMEAVEAPSTVGGFTGFGAQIWTWLTLHDLLGRDDLLALAVARAAALERLGFDAAEEQHYDVIDGTAGTIVPLLGLAEASADVRWLALAARAGRHLEAHAIVDARGARWPTKVSEAPVGGFAHGTTGIAWALTRLALSAAGDAAERQRWQALADAAFAFEAERYDAALGNWLDARLEDGGDAFNIWCYGSVGIGLAAADLYARTGAARFLPDLRRAVAAARDKWGISHTLCHGDFSLWELLARAAALDAEGCTDDREGPVAQVVSSIEEHRGVVGGLTRAAFTPGLMTGLAGAIHSLNRMHPECTLASPLLLERRVVQAA